MNNNFSDSVKNNFSKYLSVLGISSKTHKNYRSDLTHFTAWIILKIRSFGSYIETLTEAVPFLNTNLVLEYKNYLNENKVPNKTINRRLSTIRHLSKFLLSSQLVDSDFTEGVENLTTLKVTKITLSPIINEFQAYLEAKKMSKNTLKNYLSDVRQFLSWLESKNQILNSKF